MTSYKKILNTIVSLGIAKSWRIIKPFNYSSYIVKSHIHQKQVDIVVKDAPNICAIQGLYIYNFEGKKESSLLSIFFRDDNDSLKDLEWMLRFAGVKFYRICNPLDYKEVRLDEKIDIELHIDVSYDECVKIEINK